MPPAIAPCPTDFFGVQSTEFQACFDYYAALNYWPETLSISGTVAGSFQPGASRPVQVYMSREQLQQQFNQQAGAGYWPHQITALSGGYYLEPDFSIFGYPLTYDKKYKAPLFSCIWKPVEGAVESRILKSDDFPAKNQAMADAGFVLHDLCGYTANAANDGIRLIATWTTRPHGAWTTFINMTYQQAVDRFHELSAKGYQVTRFCAYIASDHTYYAAVYEQVLNGGEWYHYFNMDGPAFQAKYNELAPRGLPIRQINNQTGLYSVIWGH